MHTTPRNVATTGQQETLIKSCKWSPEGSVLLSNSDDNVLRLYSLPQSLHDETDTSSLELTTYLEKDAGESVYRVTWFPFMSISDPASCCFLASIRDHPLQLFDAFSGQTRANYCIYDHRERLIAPLGLCFNANASKIFCGYENMIEIFDITMPGETGEKYPTTPTRSSKDGQKGLISTIAFNPDMSGLYAAGSYSGTIGFYDERANSLVELLNDTGAVTQIQFSVDGKYLVSACRKENCIKLYDIRGDFGKVVREFPRQGETNQSLSFDLEGSSLFTGDTDGDILVYDILQTENQPEQARFHAHDDVIGSVSYNPFYNVLGSVSGSRDSVFDDDETLPDYSVKMWKI